MRRMIWMAGCVAGAVLVARSLVALPAQNPDAPPVPESLQVGTIATGSIHRIDRPGVYGLGQPPAGNRYAIVGNNLVRLDGETDQIKAIIRAAVRPVNEGALP